MKNVCDTILSQFENSPTILSLISSFNENIDPSVNLDDFYKYIWNVETAQGQGLDIWGRIVNVSRRIEVVADLTFFGFNEANYKRRVYNDPQPFNTFPFYSGYKGGEYFYTLTDTAYRKLIFVKAMYNITDGSAPNINKLLQYLFQDRGRCYVQDLFGMEMQYVFEFQLSAVEYSIMVKSGAIPRPSGVKTTIVQLVTGG
ncbi:DUF2612 domain-containing protein [Klebsiella pneumoniae]|uniref:DUF2612 domain-containing protein n=1 Tax=Klebsiella pneumoniae TaxID=573 RepID=UPI0012570090|nr:DUF2612 domain-containing protein [Klebsiella pneumoniae]VAP72418.1 Protein of uncharacterised function (DUF2612) [Klebsiella pneumoniae]HBW3346573.1 DUF2612 domain-containing protein [Klebsiella pneumoniae]